MDYLYNGLQCKLTTVHYKLSARAIMYYSVLDMVDLSYVEPGGDEFFEERAKPHLTAFTSALCAVTDALAFAPRPAPSSRASQILTALSSEQVAKRWWWGIARQAFF